MTQNTGKSGLEPTKSDYEPLLDENEKRYAIMPIQYDDLWQFYKKQLASMWVVEEIDLSSDKSDFESLSKDEQYFIKHILGFFAASDTLVNDNLGEQLAEITMPEAAYNLRFQSMMEDIHSDQYSLLIDAIVDESEKDYLFNAIETMPAVKEKAEWCQKWINDGNFAKRMVAFLIVEGVFFSSSFASIYWLKKKGIMKGLCSANEKISADEGCHAELSVLLYTKYVNNKLPVDEIYSMFSEAVEVERKFVTESLPVRLIGMNEKLMVEYVEFVADFWLKALGLEPIYNKKNPFPFMEMLSLEGKTNFFEKRALDYQKAGVGTDGGSQGFSLDADF